MVYCRENVRLAEKKEQFAENLQRTFELESHDDNFRNASFTFFRYPAGSFRRMRI